MTQHHNRSIYLCRHGQRLDDLRRGWFTSKDNRHDPPLSEHGKLQASLLGLRLRSEPIDHIIVSPYLRALQTADPIARQLGMNYVIETGVGEWLSKDLFGGKPEITPVQERIEDFSLIDLDYVPGVHPVYPESVPQVLERMARAVEHLLATFAGNLLIVGHGRTVTGISAALTGQPEKHFRYDNAAITKLLNQNGAWVVELNSDTTHLQTEMMML